MNIKHYWNFFFKRTLRKKSTWITLILHFLYFSVYTLTLRLEGPIIQNTNDFFRSILLMQIGVPLVILIVLFSPISWLFWWRFDDIGQETQSDGSDLFFLSTQIPTSRKSIFLGKLSFLSLLIIGLHLFAVASPLAICLWRSGYLSNFTGTQTALFLIGNFLLTPLLFFLPLTILLFSLASLKSVWYEILKWFGRLSTLLIPIFLLLYAVFLEIEWIKTLLITLTTIGIVFLLALFSLSLAYKDFEEKDLY